jgi:hypothetical protein
MFTFTPPFTGTSHNTLPFNIENQLIGFSINSFASMQEQQTEHYHSNLSPNTRSNTNFELPHSRIHNLVQQSYLTPEEYQCLEAAVWTTTPSRQTLFCESVQKGTDLPQNLDKIFRFGEVEQSIGQEREAVGEGVEQNREEVLERIRESWFCDLWKSPSFNRCVSRKKTIESQRAHCPKCRW